MMGYIIMFYFLLALASAGNTLGGAGGADGAGGAVGAGGPKKLHCTTVVQGQKTQYEIKLESKSLTKGIRDWNLDIPQPKWKCPDVDHQVGIQVQVCDLDKKPEVAFEMFNGAFVHRTGSLQGEATVDVTAFCNANYVFFDHVGYSPPKPVIAQPLGQPEIPA